MTDTHPQTGSALSDGQITGHESHREYGPRSDRRFLLYNTASGTEQLYDSRQEALDAVTEHVFEGDRWVIILLPRRTSSGYQINSGCGPSSHNPTVHPER